MSVDPAYHLILCPCGDVIEQHEANSPTLCIEQNPSVITAFEHSKAERPLFMEVATETRMDQALLAGCQKHCRRLEVATAVDHRVTASLAGTTEPVTLKGRQASNLNKEIDKLKTIKLPIKQARQQLQANMADHRDYKALGKGSRRYAFPPITLMVEIVVEGRPRLMNQDKDFATFASSQGIALLDTARLSPKAIASAAADWFHNTFLVEPGQQSSLTQAMIDTLDKLETIVIFIAPKPTSDLISMLAGIEIPDELSLLLGTIPLLAVDHTSIKEAIGTAINEAPRPASELHSLLTDNIIQVLATLLPTTVIITKNTAGCLSLCARIPELHTRTWTRDQETGLPTQVDSLLETIATWDAGTKALHQYAVSTFIHPQQYNIPRHKRPYYKRKKPGCLLTYRSTRMMQLEPAKIIDLFRPFPGK